MSKNKIKHLSFIMDGNKRWSKLKKITISQGYDHGLRKLEEVIEYCLNKKISFLSVYALSSENIKRKSVSLIFAMILSKYKELNNRLNIKKKIKINIIGSKKNLPKKINNILSDIEESSSTNKNLNLNIVFNYGVEYEIIDIISKINNNDFIKYKNNEAFLRKIITQNKYLSGMPDPDILIRTGGYQRLSNFLMLNTTYTELFFSNSLWPDFDISELDGIILKYNKINRNYGL